MHETFPPAHNVSDSDANTPSSHFSTLQIRTYQRTADFYRRYLNCRNICMMSSDGVGLGRQKQTLCHWCPSRLQGFIGVQRNVSLECVEGGNNVLFYYKDLQSIRPADAVGLRRQLSACSWALCVPALHQYTSFLIVWKACSVFICAADIDNAVDKELQRAWVEYSRHHLFGRQGVFIEVHPETVVTHYINNTALHMHHPLNANAHCHSHEDI